MNQEMKIGKATVFHADCMDYMRTVPDKFFDLAVCDPPYIDGPQKPGYYQGTKQRHEVGAYEDISDTWEIPGQEYMDELCLFSFSKICHNDRGYGHGRFAGEFPVVQRQGKCGRKTCKVHVSQPVNIGVC